MAPRVQSSPRTRAAQQVEAKLAALRADPDARRALVQRVQDHQYAAAAAAAAAANANRMMLRPIRTPEAGSSRPGTSSATSRPGTSASASRRSPSSPTLMLGTKGTWSAVDTGPDDPVGTWKDLPTTSHSFQPHPLHFGFFESEAARRKEYSETRTPPLLGPEVPPPNSSRGQRDTEATMRLLHSPLPGTLRPTPKLERAVNWQPSGKGQPAWHGTALQPTPRPAQPPSPLPPDALEGEWRAFQRKEGQSAARLRAATRDDHERLVRLGSRGVELPVRWSLRAKRHAAEAREEQSPITPRDLRRLVSRGSGRAVTAAPGVLKEMSRLDQLTLEDRQMRQHRSVLSTRFSDSLGTKKKLQWLGATEAARWRR